MTVTSPFFPRTSRRSQAACRRPLVAASSLASVFGKVVSFSPRSNSPLTTASPAAAVASRRSSSAFIARSRASEGGADLLAVDTEARGRDREQVLSDPRDVPAGVLGDVLEVDAHPLDRDRVVRDRRVVQDDDIALVSQLGDVVQVLEPKDLGHADGPLRSREGSRLVFELHRSEVEERPLFQCVGPMMAPENSTLRHEACPAFEGEEGESLLKTMVPRRRPRRSRRVPSGPTEGTGRRTSRGRCPDRSSGRTGSPTP